MNQKQYIREIVQRSCLPAAERRRLRRDLEADIHAALERGESMEQIMERMGEPDSVAAAIYESFADIPERPFREYKSQATLFGLPLVHIIRARYAPGVPRYRVMSVRGVAVGRRSGYDLGLPTARGFFAFGPKAVGVIAVGSLSSGFVSIGGISAGIISIGNISAGILSIGNISLALLIAIGNLAAGLLSAGNLSLGYATAGNVAIGQYAIGNEARGAFSFSISDLAAQINELKTFISGLDVPSPIKAFYHVIENLSELLLDPIAALHLFIPVFALLACVVVMLCVIPRRLLNLHK